MQNEQDNSQKPIWYILKPYILVILTIVLGFSIAYIKAQKHTSEKNETLNGNSVDAINRTDINSCLTVKIDSLNVNLSVSSAIHQIIECKIAEINNYLLSNKISEDQLTSFKEELQQLYSIKGLSNADNEMLLLFIHQIEIEIKHLTSK